MEKKKRISLKRIKEIKTGKLEGGFVVIMTPSLLMGKGTEPTNNCTGCASNNCRGENCGNCVIGCGQA